MKVIAKVTELLVVVPVYNEEASICRVATEWFREVENRVENFTFLVINDGSTDGTLKLLEELRKRFGRRFEILDRPNRGHGQSCIKGYRIAAEREVPYVFQIDSDGQWDPRYFSEFWRKRQ